MEAIIAFAQNINSTAINICSSDVTMFIAAMIGVAVAAVVGVGVGLYLCKRSLKVVKG